MTTGCCDDKGREGEVGTRAERGAIRYLNCHCEKPQATQ